MVAAKQTDGMLEQLVYVNCENGSFEKKEFDDRKIVAVSNGGDPDTTLIYTTESRDESETAINIYGRENEQAVKLDLSLIDQQAAHQSIEFETASIHYHRASSQIFVLEHDWATNARISSWDANDGAFINSSILSLPGFEDFGECLLKVNQGGTLISLNSLVINYSCWMQIHFNKNANVTDPTRALDLSLVKTDLLTARFGTARDLRFSIKSESQ